METHVQTQCSVDSPLNQLFTLFHKPIPQETRIRTSNSFDSHGHTLATCCNTMQPFRGRHIQT